MSGILSIAREVLSIFFPNQIPSRSLFWNCVVIAFIISAAILWYIEHQKSEKSKPILNAEIDIFAIAPAGEKDENSIVTITATITNVGAPSIVNKIAVSIKMRDKYFQGQFIPLPKDGITLKGENQSFFMKTEDYLPHKCLTQPIATGGAATGFIPLLFSELKREDISQSGTIIVLTCSDVAGEKYTFEKVMSGQRIPPLDMNKLQKKD